MKRFTIRELVFLGATGAVAGFIANLFDLRAGYWSWLPAAIVLNIGARGVPKFGSGMILCLVASAFYVGPVRAILTPLAAIRMPLLAGPVVGLAGVGLVWDLCFLVFGRAKTGYLFAGAMPVAIVMVIVLSTISIMTFVAASPQPRSDLEMLAYWFFWLMVPVSFGLGMLCAFLGVRSFDRWVSQIGFVQKMMNEANEVSAT